MVVRTGRIAEIWRSDAAHPAHRHPVSCGWECRAGQACAGRLRDMRGSFRVVARIRHPDGLDGAMRAGRGRSELGARDARARAHGEAVSRRCCTGAPYRDVQAAPSSSAARMRAGSRGRAPGPRERPRNGRDQRHGCGALYTRLFRAGAAVYPSARGKSPRSTRNRPIALRSLGDRASRRRTDATVRSRTSRRHTP